MNCYNFLPTFALCFSTTPGREHLHPCSEELEQYWQTFQQLDTQRKGDHGHASHSHCRPGCLRRAYLVGWFGSLYSRPAGWLVACLFARLVMFERLLLRMMRAIATGILLIHDCGKGTVPFAVEKGTSSMGFEDLRQGSMIDSHIPRICKSMDFNAHEDQCYCRQIKLQQCEHVCHLCHYCVGTSSQPEHPKNHGLIVDFHVWCPAKAPVDLMAPSGIIGAAEGCPP